MSISCGRSDLSGHCTDLLEKGAIAVRSEFTNIIVFLILCLPPYDYSIVQHLEFVCAVLATLAHFAAVNRC